MKKYTSKSILLCLILVMILSLALVGCKNKEYIPDKQGSKVMTMDNRDITGTETDIFTSYASFAGSEYGGMKLDNSNYPAKKSFYRLSFFRKHDLIVTKFNDESGIHHFINNITKKDNTYTVTILRFRDDNAPQTKQTYACCLEMPTREKVDKDTKVILDIQPVFNIQTLVSGKSLLSSSDPISLATIESYADMLQYCTQLDDKTKADLAVFDEEFFTSNAILAVDYLARDNTIFTYSLANNQLDINLYHSDHYTKDADKMTRRVKYIPISLSLIVDKIMFNSYYEADVDVANSDTHEELGRQAFASKK